MDKKRKVYAPFSQTSEAGVTQTPVEGYIDVNQTIYPTVSTGVVNEKGIWSGVKSDDVEFTIMGADENIPNGGEVLAPAGDPDHIDMSGFKDLLIAIKPTSGGNYAMSAVIGPDTNRFANLSPINSGTNIRGNVYDTTTASIETLFSDGGESMTGDVWNIYPIQGRLSGQKILQFKITNNSGGASDIQFAFMRLV